MAASQEFSGSAANRLDAFIQRANAVRTPALAPVRGQDGNGLNVTVTPSAAALKASPTRNSVAQAPTAHAPATQAQASQPQAIARATPSHSSGSLKLANDGNTDVAQWMMRALDRYESMKTQEQS